MLWFLGALKQKVRAPSKNWSGPYELYRLYENGSARLRDLEVLELPERVNIGKLRK